mgnify:CR=1 FL=1
MGMVKFYLDRFYKYCISHGNLVGLVYLIISDILLMKIYLDIILTYDIIAIRFAYVMILFSNSRISSTISKKLDDCYFYDKEPFE